MIAGTVSAQLLSSAGGALGPTPPDVVRGTEAVLRATVEIALKRSIQLRQLAKQALSKSPVPDPLMAFSEMCRADLGVRRNVP
jgi:hypothetical protein